MRIFAKLIFIFITITCMGACFPGAIVAQQEIDERIDWPQFMSRHDILWDRLPTEYREAAWTGNGLIGTYLWHDKTRNLIRLQVFRSDVMEHRPFSQGHSGVTRSRLQIGSFYLKPVGKILEGSWRQILWNAEVRGTIITDKGKIDFIHFTHTRDLVIQTTTKTTGNENGSEWIWEPAKAATTRKSYPKNEKEIEKYINSYHSKWLSEVYDPDANPEPKLSLIEGVNVSLQKLYYGGEHAVAWKEKTKGRNKTLLISISKLWPEEKGSSAEIAVKDVNRIAKQNKQESIKWIEEHRDWWHKYYKLSFVSLPDTRIETVYWLNIHKLACATRANRPMMDTSGLWQVPSKWPFVTWDLNVQLCYWLPVASNRIETIGMSLINDLNKYKQNLVENVEPVEWQKDAAYLSLNTGMDLAQPRFSDGRILTRTGANLPWAMHNCYMMYESTMDEELLKEKIFPILKRAINFQFYILRKQPDGKYGFSNTMCPEYGLSQNCNYELSIFKWGCKTLLEICERLSIEDPLIPKWKDALDNLVDFPYDEKTGYMVGENETFQKAHRHYSHLLQIYPFYIQNIEKEGEKERILKSINHFYKTNHDEYIKTGNWGVLAGYTLTGLSSMYSSIGEGNSALKSLQTYINYDPKIVFPNGMYGESGPCLETPLSAAQAILDMLIQSWGGKIRVFPALPASWNDISFKNLRARGAFLVSAKREAGKTKFVHIKSLAGEFCQVKIDFKPKEIYGINIENLGNQVYSIDLKKGEECILMPADNNDKSKVITPVKAKDKKTNWFGLNKSRKQITEQNK